MSTSWCRARAVASARSRSSSPRRSGRRSRRTTSRAKREAVEALGADRVVDHGSEDVARVVRDVDVLFDVGAHGRLSELRRTLAPGGRIVLVGPGSGNWLGPITRVGTAAIGSIFTDRKALPFLSSTSTDDLVVLRDLIEAGRLRPLIDRAYPLEATGEAIARVESGEAIGKVVISVATGDPGGGAQA